MAILLVLRFEYDVPSILSAWFRSLSAQRTAQNMLLHVATVESQKEAVSIDWSPSNPSRDSKRVSRRNRRYHRRRLFYASCQLVRRCVVVVYYDYRLQCWARWNPLLYGLCPSRMMRLHVLTMRMKLWRYGLYGAIRVCVCHGQWKRMRNIPSWYISSLLE